MVNPLFIHCIGDSHVSVFSGTDRMQPIWPELSDDQIPLFKTYRLGPVTAYNLNKIGSSTKGREKLFEVLESLPRGSNVLLCFGEIDCRVHLLKQAISQKRVLEEVVKECVEHYFRVVLEVKSMGFIPTVFAVIPSTVDGTIVETDYIAFGSSQERNNVTKIFNDYLKKLVTESSINFLSIFDELIDLDGLTNFFYYSDHIHLSQKAMPLIVKKMKYIFPNMEEAQLFKSTILNSLVRSVQYKIFYLICYLRAYKIQLKKINNMIKEKILKVIDKSKFLREKKQIIDWYRRGRPVPPPHIIKEQVIKKYARRFNARIFIESGTYLGDMIAVVLPYFKKIYSIELSPELAKKAKERFYFNTTVQIREGDSGKIIGEILKEINEPALFWLDGHYSAGITAKGELVTPIFAEMKAIFSHNIKNHVIIIDDARLFVGQDDYPSLAELKLFIQEYGPDYTMLVADDSIRLVHK